jgi:hypothetical protein
MNKKEFTMEKMDNVMYLRMALALSGISIDRFTAELVIKTWQEIEKKGGNFNIKDSVSIEWTLRKKYQSVKAVAVKDKTNNKNKRVV